MSLFAIADLHLSLSTNKPMDKFKGWENYVNRIKTNWEKTVAATDTVVVAGDVSWGMNLDEAREDFAFIDNLPGQKILLKGNHDYYFLTKTKTETFFKKNNFNSLKILHNNSYEYNDYSICGTRGWINEPGEKSDEKVLKREANRLKISLDSAKLKPIVFTHYPPICAYGKAEEFLAVLKKYGVDKLYYGHLHGQSCRFAIEGKKEGIDYKLISADHLNFTPYLVLEDKK